MAFGLQRLPPTSDVVRIIREQVQSADASLSSKRISDAAIHESRKATKRARAALRLLLPALSRTHFEHLNFGLRDVARTLTTMRDAKVLLEALAVLRAGDPTLASQFYTKLEKNLKAERARLSREMRATPRRMSTTRNALVRLADEAVGLRLRVKGWDSLGGGFERIYRRGRRAMRRAQEQPTDDNLHEWRKQVKHLWHALQIFEPVKPQQLQEWARRAHRLADHLGDDHDLSILRLKALDIREHAEQKLRFVQSLERRRKRLQRRAWTLGEALYSKRPASMRQWLERQWRHWQPEHSDPSAQHLGQRRRGSGVKAPRGRSEQG